MKSVSTVCVPLHVWVRREEIVLGLTSQFLCRDCSPRPVWTAHSVWSCSPLSLVTPALHSHWSGHFFPPAYYAISVEQNPKCKRRRRRSSSPASGPGTLSCNTGFYCSTKEFEDSKVVSQFSSQLITLLFGISVSRHPSGFCIPSHSHL